MTHLPRKLTMYKYIGFDIDYKQTVVCVVQPGQSDRFRTLRTDVGQLRHWLKTKRGLGDRIPERSVDDRPAIVAKPCINVPDLTLDCELCEGPHRFHCDFGRQALEPEKEIDLFLDSICVNCERFAKTYAVRIEPADDTGLGRAFTTQSAA